ncbi:MAG TPA: SCO family protein [Tepidisphaeraceae bacterium]
MKLAGITIFAAMLMAISAGTARASFTPDASAGTQSPLPLEYRNVGIDEHLNSQLPLDLKFIDEKAQYVTLGQMLHPNKPILLQLGYLECPMLCDTISRGLVDSSKKIGLDIGKDFDFVFVSIDPSDSADLARLKKNSYVTEYDRPGSADGFHVLVGMQPSIDRIARAVGYRYQPAKNGQFAHPAVAMVITPDGKISRYLYGVTFPSQTLRLSLVEASQGKIGTSLDQILLICLHWDPNDGKYSWAAMNLMRVGGVLTMMVLGGAIFWMVRHGTHARLADERNGTTGNGATGNGATGNGAKGTGIKEADTEGSGTNGTETH